MLVTIIHQWFHVDEILSWFLKQPVISLISARTGEIIRKHDEIDWEHQTINCTNGGRWRRNCLKCWMNPGHRCQLPIDRDGCRRQNRKLLPPIAKNENDRKKWGLAADIRGRVWAVLDPFCVATSRWVWRRTWVYWGRSYKIPYGAGSGNKYKWNQSGPGQSALSPDLYRTKSRKRQ